MGSENLFGRLRESELDVKKIAQGARQNILYSVTFRNDVYCTCGLDVQTFKFKAWVLY